MIQGSPNARIAAGQGGKSYREQQARIARRARERARRRYRIPAIALFAAGLAISTYGEGPWAVALAVVLGCAAVLLGGVDGRLGRD
jgi:fatty acid desaturase